MRQVAAALPEFMDDAVGLQKVGIGVDFAKLWRKLMEPYYPFSSGEKRLLLLVCRGARRLSRQRAMSQHVRHGL